MWSILEHIPCVLGENLHSPSVGCSVLSVSVVHWIYSIVQVLCFLHSTWVVTQTFICTHIITFFKTLYFFTWIWITISSHFLLVWRNWVNISCNTSMIATNFLSPCLFGNTFTSPFLRIALLNTTFLDDCVFLSSLSKGHFTAFWLYCFWLAVSC